MVDVLEYYGADIPPGAGGSRWVSLRCPFHDDRTPSASTDGVRFRCFAGCVEGDIVDVVRWAEGLELPEAVRWIEETFDVRQD